MIRFQQNLVCLVFDIWRTKLWQQCHLVVCLKLLFYVNVGYLILFQSSVICLDWCLVGSTARSSYLDAMFVDPIFYEFTSLSLCSVSILYQAWYLQQSTKNCVKRNQDDCLAAVLILKYHVFFGLFCKALLNNVNSLFLFSKLWVLLSSTFR